MYVPLRSVAQEPYVIHPTPRHAYISGLTVSEAETDIMSLQTKGGGKVSFTINAAGEVYKQTIEFVYLGGAITADRDLSIEITRRLRRAWACFQRYKMEIYDRPNVRLRLKVRLLKAEVVETLHWRGGGGEGGPSCPRD